MILLLNSAIMPQPGIYRAFKATPAHFAASFHEDLAEDDGEFESYIGYPQTAAHLSKLLEVAVPVSREQTKLEDGDTLYVCKLAYRLQDPATKGQPQIPDYEYLIVHYEEEEL